MANAKRLNQLHEDYGMTDEHLYELTESYFEGNNVRWFYFDLATDLHISSSSKEIDVKVNLINSPEHVTIQLREVDTPADPSSNIDYGRLTPYLIQQLKTVPLPTQFGNKIVDGIALTIGQIGSDDKFLLLELYIKKDGKIVIVRPFPPIVGDNLTPTSIPPGRRRR